jgi:AcrR family transcriptional regulator
MDNKEKIMQCALELFANKGYDGTGIQEITQISEVTKPTLYYYFGNGGNDVMARLKALQ